jgi:hypothetical protein
MDFDAMPVLGLYKQTNVNCNYSLFKYMDVDAVSKNYYLHTAYM